MELSVHVLVRFLDTLYCVDDVERVYQVDVNGAGVADESHDGGRLAFAEVDVETHAFEP